MFSDVWDSRFLELANHIAQWSKDPSTKVGCVVVGPDKEIRSTGFNGFPRGIKDDYRLADREEKYPRICHAEENAIMQAARIGVSVNGCAMYITQPPCCRCARSIVQVGISRVTVYSTTLSESWRKDITMAEDLLREARVFLSVRSR